MSFVLVIAGLIIVYLFLRLRQSRKDLKDKEALIQIKEKAIQDNEEITREYEEYLHAKFQFTNHDLEFFLEEMKYLRDIINADLGRSKRYSMIVEKGRSIPYDFGKKLIDERKGDEEYARRIQSHKDSRTR
ncbi:hypothetical protein [Salipaludibacillus keqinensis]|nr:hypothetical protein [Salipaludibacillus keqinensis]